MWSAKSSMPQLLSWSVVLLVVCCCVVVVVAEVELAPKSQLNYHDLKQYKDCNDLHRAGYNVSGSYVLYMDVTTPFILRCEFTKNNAFNVIQRRIDGNVNFTQPLSAYISGFGQLQGDYWAGLNIISYLTLQQHNNVLNIHMQDWSGNNKSVRYASFLVLHNEYHYLLFVSGYSGSAPDDMSSQNGMIFKTYDYPDQHNCAPEMHAGWWYNDCADTLLNGHYYNGGTYTPNGRYYDGIYWKDWHGYNYSLKNGLSARTEL